MTTTELLEHLRAEAMKLPEAERRELVRSLQDTLDDGEVDPAWREELNRRIDGIDDGTARARPAAAAFAAIRSRFGW